MYSSSMERILRLAQQLTTPLLPDDYLTLIDPLLAQNTLRARVTAVTEHRGRSRTISLATGRDFPAFRAGQHVLVGVDVNAVRHWRTFSLTSSATRRPTRELEITVKATGRGGVADFLVEQIAVGDVILLEPASGEFTLVEASSEPLLFVAGGSGITPFLSMLRTLSMEPDQPQVTLIYSAQAVDEMVAANELVDLADESDWFTLVLWESGLRGHLDFQQLPSQVPDWALRSVYVCGPAGMLTAADSHWRTAGLIDSLVIEQFQTQLAAVEGQGGSISFTKSSREVFGAPDVALLDVGEAAGVLMPSGCRIGICHTCVVPLKSGRVRDLRTGELHGEPNELIQTCINAAACDVELDV